MANEARRGGRVVVVGDGRCWQCVQLGRQAGREATKPRQGQCVQRAASGRERGQVGTLRPCGRLAGQGFIQFKCAHCNQSVSGRSRTHAHRDTHTVDATPRSLSASSR